MKHGFSFELYGTIFTNCFLHSSRYSNGRYYNSAYLARTQPQMKLHILQILLLEQNSKLLGEDEIVVDCKFKPTLIPQLLELGIIKNQTGICVVNNSIYPIYTIDTSKVQKNYCYAEELIAA